MAIFLNKSNNTGGEKKEYPHLLKNYGLTINKAIYFDIRQNSNCISPILLDSIEGDEITENDCEFLPMIFNEYWNKSSSEYKIKEGFTGHSFKRNEELKRAYNTFLEEIAEEIDAH